MQLVPSALFLGRIGPNCPVGPRLRAGPPALTSAADAPTDQPTFTSKAHAIPRGSISAFMLSSKHLTMARLPLHFSTRHLAPNLAIEFGQRPLRAASSSLAALSPSQMGSKGSITARWHPNAAERVASASSRPRYGRGNWRGAFQDPMRRPSPLFRPAGHSRLPACRPLPRPSSGFPLSVLRPSNWHLFMSLGASSRLDRGQHLRCLLAPVPSVARLPTGQFTANTSLPLGGASEYRASTSMHRRKTPIGSADID